MIVPDTRPPDSGPGSRILIPFLWIAAGLLGIAMLLRPGYCEMCDARNESSKGRLIIENVLFHRTPGPSPCRAILRKLVEARGDNLNPEKTPIKLPPGVTREEGSLGPVYRTSELIEGRRRHFAYFTDGNIRAATDRAAVSNDPVVARFISEDY